MFLVRNFHHSGSGYLLTQSSNGLSPGTAPWKPLPAWSTRLAPSSGHDSTHPAGVAASHWAGILQLPASLTLPLVPSTPHRIILPHTQCFPTPVLQAAQASSGQHHDPAVLHREGGMAKSLKGTWLCLAHLSQYQRHSSQDSLWASAGLPSLAQCWPIGRPCKRLPSL